MVHKVYQKCGFRVFDSLHPEASADSCPCVSTTARSFLWQLERVEGMQEDSKQYVSAMRPPFAVNDVCPSYAIVLNFSIFQSSFAPEYISRLLYGIADQSRTVPSRIVTFSSIFFLTQLKT